MPFPLLFLRPSARKTLYIVALALSPMTIALADTAVNSARPTPISSLRLEIGKHAAPITGLAADAEGRYLVSVSGDDTARVWSTANGELLTVLRPPSSPRYASKAIAITSDARLIAMWGESGESRDVRSSIYIFDRASGRMLRRIDGLPNAISQLAFSPNGTHLAAGMNDKGGRVFEIATGRLIGESGDECNSVAVHARGERGADDFRVACAPQQDGTIRLWQLGATGLANRKERFESEFLGTQSLAFSPDGKRLAIGTLQDGTVIFLDGATLDSADYISRVTLSDGARSEQTDSVAWSADGQTLWTIGASNKDDTSYLNRWKMVPAPPAITARYGDKHNTFKHEVLLTRRGVMTSLVTLSGSRVGYVYDGAWYVESESGATQKGGMPILAAECRERPLELSADGLEVRVGTLIFDLKTRSFRKARTDGGTTKSASESGQLSKLERNGSVTCIALTEEGYDAVVGTADELLRKTLDGATVWRQKEGGGVVAVSATNGDKTVVAAYRNGSIRWHRYSDGKELLALYADSDSRRWVMWTPNGYFDSSAGAEGLIGWRIPQGSDKEARFVTAQHFSKMLRRPDLIARAARGEDPDSFPAVDLARLLNNGDALRTPPLKVRP